MIDLRSQGDVDGMRAAGRAAARVLADLRRRVAPGVTTGQLDAAAADLMRLHGCESACLGYVVGRLTYPGRVCISVNDEVVHGIGHPGRVLQEGDLVSLDVVVRKGEFIGDNAATVPVGAAPEPLLRLCAATEAALQAGIQAARPGGTVGDISAAIQGTVQPLGLGIVREFVGHGVGRRMHEEPQVPNWGRKGTGPRLQPGMALAIEPMITLGSPKIAMDPDGWTARTRDGSPAAHFEHTVLLTEGGVEILTLP
jgi:methionyl aminopeptidase